MNAAFGAATLALRLLLAQLAHWLGHRLMITVGLFATAAAVSFGLASKLYEPGLDGLDGLDEGICCTDR